MIIYLLKFTLCLLALLAFYKLALEPINMHRFKRFYLLGVLFFALAIPATTFNTNTPPPSTTSSPRINITVNMLAKGVPAAPPAVSSVNYIPLVLWSIYFLGMAFFGFRFIRNLWQIRNAIGSNTRLKTQTHTKVLLPKEIVPYSFLRYIFVPKQAFEQGEVVKEVLLHEQAHVSQRHSLDILFIEFVQVFLWWNPLIHFTKKAIKLNHEFLADQQVIGQTEGTLNYQNLLLYYAGNKHIRALASGINYSSSKQRILMISKPFSRKKNILRFLMVLPLLALCTILFSSKVNTPPAEKTIHIQINKKQITLNNKQVTLGTFAQALNNIAHKYPGNELAGFHFYVQKRNTKESFINQVNQAFQHTRFARVNNKKSLLIPPPPPLLPAKAHTSNGVFLKPVPHPGEYIKKMGKQSAKFYYQRKEVSTEKALKIIEEKENMLAVKVTTRNTPVPVFCIKDKPVL